MTYGFPGSEFAEVRWEIFWRTRKHTYSCLMLSQDAWHKAWHRFKDFSCDCDAGDIRGKYLGDLIVLA